MVWHDIINGRNFSWNYIKEIKMETLLFWIVSFAMGFIVGRVLRGK